MQIITRALNDAVESAIDYESDRVSDYYDRQFLAGDFVHRMDRKTSPTLAKLLRDEGFRA